MAGGVLHNLFRSPAISVPAMKHRPHHQEQDDLLCPSLVDMIDPERALVNLAVGGARLHFCYEAGPRG